MQIQIALCDDREEDVRSLGEAVRAWAGKTKVYDCTSDISFCGEFSL